MLILVIVVALLLGSYFAAEHFNTEMKERSGASQEYGRDVESFNTSTSTSVEGGASQKYDWTVPPPPIQAPPPKYDWTVPPPPPTQAPPPPPGQPVQPTVTCPSCQPATVINSTEICRNCDITMNKDIDKYVLKSSVPPCPNLSKYVLKSDLPACPTQQPCPKCPLCPACPTMPNIDPAEIQRNKEIVEDIRRHPQYATLMSQCQGQSVTAPQPMPPVPAAPLDRKSLFDRLTSRDPPPNQPIQQAVQEVDRRIAERQQTQEQDRRIRSVLTDIAKPMPGQVMSENELANTMSGAPIAYPTWITLNNSRG